METCMSKTLNQLFQRIFFDNNGSFRIAYALFIRSFLYIPTAVGADAAHHP